MPSKIIEFTSADAFDLFPPEPVKKNLPNWYKESHSYLGNTKVKNSSNLDIGFPTIKKCFPVFDALSTGYLLYTQVDLQFENSIGGKSWVYAGKDFINPVSTHEREQLQQHPLLNKQKEGNALKFEQPFSIKTPVGYSCLFVTPFHRELPFRIFEGIVDTDTYTVPINFPFYFIQNDFAGFIPAGTPIAQVIPFKRDSFKMKLNQRNINLQINIKQAQGTFFNSFYKNKFWQKKHFE